jgi:RND superfamily putative drug exporter
MAYTAHSILAQGFGAGYDAPLVVVAEVAPGTPGLGPVADAVRATGGVASVTPPRTSPDGGAQMFVAFPTTGTQDAATPALVHHLRDSVIPEAVAGSDTRVYVGGPNAGTIDFADSVSSRLPWLIAVVVGLSLIVLLILVRSVLIAVKAAVMTLLSTMAAYGVLTAVVQWGWLGHALGFPEAMPITTWVPLFIFPILFGLSTDYEVFLISRIREEYDAGANTREAVARGLSHTARVITAAAAIMVVVFATVLLGGDIAVKQFGLGLAVAVLLDATLVRMVLVPALMELLGAANWWLPRWLARILPAAEARPAAPAEPSLIGAAGGR